MFLCLLSVRTKCWLSQIKSQDNNCCLSKRSPWICSGKKLQLLCLWYLDGNSFLKNILFLLLLLFYVELRRKLCQNPKIKQQPSQEGNTETGTITDTQTVDRTDAWKWQQEVLRAIQHSARLWALKEARNQVHHIFKYNQPSKATIPTSQNNHLTPPEWK